MGNSNSSDWFVSPEVEPDSDDDGADDSEGNLMTQGFGKR